MILCLMGVPCSGKTTLVRKLIKEAPNYEVKKFKKLRFMINKSRKLVIFGLYPEEGIFSGTDMLSMDILDDTFLFLKKFLNKYPKFSILIEGDRFNNSKFYDHLKEKGYQHKLLVLDVDAETLRTRHIRRKDSQSPEFLKRCETKIENVKKNHKHELLTNEDSDTASNLGIIKECLGISPKIKVK